jgi:hypothetical protein
VLRRTLLTMNRRGEPSSPRHTADSEVLRAITQVLVVFDSNWGHKRLSQVNAIFLAQYRGEATHSDEFHQRRLLPERTRRWFSVGFVAAARARIRGGVGEIGGRRTIWVRRGWGASTDSPTHGTSPRARRSGCAWRRWRRTGRPAYEWGPRRGNTQWARLERWGWVAGSSYQSAERAHGE